MCLAGNASAATVNATVNIKATVAFTAKTKLWERLRLKRNRAKHAF